MILRISSCTSTKNIVSFTNENIDFSNYETYNIVNYKKRGSDFSLQGAVFFEKIERGITDVMDSKQYIKSNTPQIIIRYEIISGISVNTNNNSTYNNRRNYGNNYYDPFDVPLNSAKKQIEGVLLIELKDRRSKKLMWQGSLDLKYSSKGENNKYLILDAIQTIFSEYRYVAKNNIPQQKDTH